ncbi:ankyrin repeat and SOCS box protein 18-like [Saccoglossus kowalevskii]|uniref:Ankyrin repeat and SOCS box protein 18-like n=1 Tax=Saccoglossus kowalevskii TaxID=10224 RepID=A0ABM0LW63_SACKO|nr:PREDICTED: ankyrin repeat and SOCS box protein 18-like [Saccoglossus kowalevskii]
MDSEVCNSDSFFQYFKQVHQIWKSLPSDVKQSTQRLYYQIIQADRSELLNQVLLAGFSPNVDFTVDDFSRNYIDSTNMALHNITTLSALQVSAENASYDCMKILLENGAEANQSDNTCLLYYVYKNADLPALKLLLQHGANPDERTTTGMPLLCLCALTGDSEFVKLLVSHGASVHNADIATLATPLHYAVSNSFGNHFDCVQTLLENHANTNARNRRNETPAFLAAGQGNVRALELLQRHGGYINIFNSTNSTALHMAFASGKTSCVELLINLIPDLNVIDLHGYTVLDLALRFQDTFHKLDNNFDQVRVDPAKYVRKLINHGACFSKFSQEDFALLIDRSPQRIKLIGLVVNAYSNCNYISYISNTTNNHHGDDGDETDELYFEFYKSFFQAANKPRSLQHLCRYKLRCYNGKLFCHVVESLEIPQNIKKYLLLDDPCDLM